MSTLMIDCTTGNVGAVLAQFGAQQAVAGYVTGPGVEWTEWQFALFARKIRIAQSADLWLDEQSEARCLDVERWAATPDDWPEWFASRTDKTRATCYCSLSSVQAVVDASLAADEAGSFLPPRWWLAWYWDRPGFPSMEQVFGELSKYTSFAMPPSRLWAVQAKNFPLWDESAVFGVPDFSRR